MQADTRGKTDIQPEEWERKADRQAGERKAQADGQGQGSVSETSKKKLGMEKKIIRWAGEDRIE